ncbi:hypothetical protein [Flavobacterium sp. 3HN19-14]|uniref:hypothetical protein n=1 Tax=Flavobacterium sp. 3HN19-14 TaxID=3448133 RepID=UPI003EE2DBA4
MKKPNKLSIFIALLFLQGLAYSQCCNEVRPSANDSLYIKALTEYTKALEREPRRSVGENVEPKTLYLARCTYLFDMPEMINGYKVFVLWPNDQEKYVKKNNNKLIVLDLLPLTFEDGKFKIHIIQELATSGSKNDLDWADFGLGVTTYFKLEKGKMVFDQTKVVGAYLRK